MNQNNPVWMKPVFPMLEMILLSSHGPPPPLVVDPAEKEILAFSFQNGTSLHDMWAELSQQTVLTKKAF